MSGEAALVPDAIARLAGGNPSEAFLAPHHLEAASRVTRLFERAHLRQRVTMSYDPARIGRSRGGAQGDLSDTSVDARKKLSVVAKAMSPDCWGVLSDVCLFDKGLQVIEVERCWPRRSAKLVLRIGLDQVASQMGLGELAVGQGGAASRSWLPERLPMF